MASHLSTVLKLAIVFAIMHTACVSSCSKRQEAAVSNNALDSLQALMEEKKINDKIKIQYDNGLVSISTMIDPGEDFYIEMHGMLKSSKVPLEDTHLGKEQSIERVKPTLDSANCAIKNYLLAQKKADAGNYIEALNAINNSLDCMKTGESLALKGSLYFLMKDTVMAQHCWNQAVERDPTINIPKLNK